MIYSQHNPPSTPDDEIALAAIMRADRIVLDDRAAIAANVTPPSQRLRQPKRPL